MFSNAKVGDRVWDYVKGWGTIIDTCYDSVYRICVQYDKTNNSDCYTTSGKIISDAINPSLFWDEIKFEVPK